MVHFQYTETPKFQYEEEKLEFPGKILPEELEDPELLNAAMNFVLKEIGASVVGIWAIIGGAPIIAFVAGVFGVAKGIEGLSYFKELDARNLLEK